MSASLFPSPTHRLEYTLAPTDPRKTPRASASASTPASTIDAVCVRTGVQPKSRGQDSSHPPKSQVLLRPSSPPGHSNGPRTGPIRHPHTPTADRPSSARPFADRRPAGAQTLQRSPLLPPVHRLRVRGPHAHPAETEDECASKVRTGASRHNGLARVRTYVRAVLASARSDESEKTEMMALTTTTTCVVRPEPGRCWGLAPAQRATGFGRRKGPPQLWRFKCAQRVAARDDNKNKSQRNWEYGSAGPRPKGRGPVISALLAPDRRAGAGA
ncbi:hypothetical protein C8Q78DRAFT_713884 [Trametes maxima]|nr:hypothetical protein C8Q78DRAFT_713884 [Trametes maxima]